MTTIPLSVQNHPKIKFIQGRYQQTVALALEKAAAHLQHPAQFPLPPGNTKSLERAFYELVKTLPGKRQDKFLDKMKTALASTPQQREQKYGALAAVNLAKAQSVLDQVKSIVVPDVMKISETDLQTMEAEIFPKRKAFAGNNATSAAKTPRAAKFATKLNFVVDNLVCHKTNDVRKDEIMLGAFGTDASGVASSVAPFLAGKFKKGETVALGAKGTLFSFTIGDGLGGGSFPESFAAGFFIVEKDLIHNQETSDKLALVFSIMGEILIGIALVCLFIPGVPKLLLFLLGGIGLGFNILGHFIIPVITDDFAEPIADSFVLNEIPRVGDFFVRTFDFSINTSTGFTKGSYTANVKWVVE